VGSSDSGLCSVTLNSISQGNPFFFSASEGKLRERRQRKKEKKKKGQKKKKKKKKEREKNKTKKL